MFMNQTLTTEQRLQKAAIDIMGNPKYIALAGVMMIGKRVVDDKVPTACTNGRDEFYGRAFVDSLNDAELRFLVLHEVYHKLYRHLHTWKHLYDDNPRLANVACVVGETHITMADGSVRRAENIRVGDMVATPFGPSPVLAVRVTENREVCELDMRMGNKLICTPDHKILTERGYVEAQHLTETDAVFVDTRDGGPSAGEARHHADKGYRAAARGHAACGVWQAQNSRVVGIPVDREATLVERLGSLVAYGLGLLRGLGGRGGDRHLPAYAGQIPQAHIVGDEYKLQLDALVGIAGDVLRSGPQRLRELILESGGQRVLDTSGVGRYSSLGQNPRASLRNTHGDHQDSSGAWVSVPADTAHHELVGGVEGFEPARLAARRFLSTRRKVYDITTAAQCFVAQGIVVHNCDYVINIKLVDDNKDKFATMTGPLTMGCLDEKYRGWDSAAVFHDLKKEGKGQGGGGQGQPGKGQGQGQGQGDGLPEGFDEHDWENAQQMSDEEKRELARDIDEAIRQGALVAGKTGSGGSREFDELLQAQVDWREVLREFIKDTCAGEDDTTWDYPERRFIGEDIYMPSGISEQVGEIVFAPDMSGSIGSREIRAMMSEAKGMIETVHPEGVRILYWDTAVCNDEYYAADELDNMLETTKPAGGGGTDVSCVPAYMAEKRITPQAAVVLTDGYLGGDWGNWNCPVLWIVVDNKNAVPPFGKVVHIKARDLV